MGMKERYRYLFCCMAVLLLSCWSLPSMAWGADPVAVRVDEFLSTLPKDFYGLSVQGLKAALDAGEPLVVVDVREQSEFDAGHIEGALHIPLRQLAKNLDRLPAAKDSPLALICRSGGRSSYATMALWLLGYRNLKNILGGMQAWEREGFPLVK